jgi:hypothetical protein
MTATNLVFSLEFTSWDAPPESGGTEVIVKPTLEAFSNAALAASSHEGINIVEGDLWFFAADGSPLEAVFSEQPYFDSKRSEYFAGIYCLRAGRGKTLREMVLEGYPADAPIIVRVATSNEAAQRYGWTDVEEMKNKVNQALEGALPDLTGLFDFESLPIDSA